MRGFGNLMWDMLDAADKALCANQGMGSSRTSIPPNLDPSMEPYVVLMQRCWSPEQPDS